MIKDMYKVVFNYYTKKEGYNTFSELIAAMNVGLVLLFYLVAASCTILLIFSPQSFTTHELP
ncbi:hypothetical protein SAMN04489864_10166 [Pedobacter insulae]|uniref:Uncharacterized protein n=1 Tax=Pedobacter insulae TaxID=414048 RepID=A0A1I2SUE9_9SPHI|nr:hypothetical protein SAMN04489864_10166 [Pedobacter insulae]